MKNHLAKKMNSTLKKTFVAAAILSAGLYKAQVINGNNAGTLNYVPVFMGTTTPSAIIGNSQIYQTSGGAVGIGTTTPGRLLEVKTGSQNGGIRVTQFGAGFSSLDLYNSTTSGRNWTIASLGAINTECPGGFGIYDFTSGGNRMMINTNGYMGIGVTSPVTRLHVAGDITVSTSSTIPTSSALIKSTTTWSAAGTPDYTWSGNSTVGLFHPAPNVIGFSSNGLEAMRVHSNGFIGVNNTAPSQMLHMNNGAILLQGTVPGVGGAQILLGGTVGTQTYGQYGIEYETAADVGYPSGGLNFWKPFLSTGAANTNNILFLNDAGKVGVNTANPTAQLTVNGTALIGDPASVTLPAGYKLYVQTGILTEKVKVALINTTDWADYVFDKNYQLKPLSEVKNYVDQNKHLPGVPSAEDLKKEGGIDLAKMAAKQMEKIEELTLYLIQLEKQNKELNERLLKLENSK